MKWWSNRSLIVFENPQERKDWCKENDIDFDPRKVGLLEEDVAESCRDELEEVE